MLQKIFDFIVNTFYFIKFFCKMAFHEDFHNHVVTDTKTDRHSDIMQVLANGPSLKVTIEKLLSGEIEGKDMCMVNFTANMEEFFHIKPQYYVISDPKFYVIDQWNKDNVEKLYDNLNNRVDWPMTIYIQFTWWKDKEYMKRFTNPLLNIVPMHTRRYEGYERFRLPLMTRNIGGANFGTVVHHAINNGILLGYKEIHLYGVDHTFFEGLCVTDDNIVCRGQKHVYDTEAEVKPLYYNHYLTGERLPYTMTRFLEEYAFLYKGHERMKAFADYMGVKIINKTSPSMLDVYQRK